VVHNAAPRDGAGRLHRAGTAGKRCDDGEKGKNRNVETVHAPSPMNIRAMHRLYRGLWGLSSETVRADYFPV
ncbi:MAG: hypothetical protein LBR67_00290, partial [Dysgonamonadaceae bacterium]|nr:hypothetical protein [Dysgonamonadaceae bacterium]